MGKPPDDVYDVFVSYADADAAWVEGYLLDALDEAGINYHTEEAFALGVPRLVEFERAIRSSRRTLLILSQAYLADEFNQFTDLLAQTYGLETATWPVIPFILHAVQLPPRIAGLVKLVGADPDAWEKSIERLCQTLQKPVPALPPKPACPYPGMRPFDEADSARFFGRDRQVREMIERLRLHPFMAVIGPSGSGKSSLVYAGFLPALRRSGYFDGEWQVAAMRPGERPLSRLHDLFSCDAPAARRLLIVDQFEETFGPNVHESDAFQAELLDLVQQSDCYIVLTVRADFYADLMACPLWDEIRQHRLEVPPLGEAELRQAIVRPAEDVDVFVETALVERLLADAAGEPGVLPLVQETLVLLWESVERRFLPARAYEALILAQSEYLPSAERGGRTGLQVAIARRADAALAELAPAGQSVARRILMRLVQFGQGRADTRRQQSVSALRSAGDDEGLFGRTLAHLVDSRLLTLSSEEGERDRRVDIAHEALIAGWPKLQTWLNERREAEQIRRRLEGKAAEWRRLGQGQGGLLDEVELLEAERWMDSADAADLGYGETLSQLVRASRVEIERVERAQEQARQRELQQVQALAESERQRAQEQAHSARRLRRVLGILALMVVVSIVSAGLAFVSRSQEQLAKATAVFNARVALTEEARALLARETSVVNEQIALTQEAGAVRSQATAQANALLAVQSRSTAEAASTLAVAERDEAQRQRQISLARQLAAQALNHLDEQPDLALLLGVESSRRLDSVETRSVLLSTLQNNPHLIAYLHGHTGGVRSVAVHPDGRILATGGADGAIILWDPDRWLRIGEPLRGHEAAVKSVAFSPDGRILASASDDETVILWDTMTWTPLGGLPLRGHTDKVNSVAFRPDGRVLASGSSDGTVILWDVQSRTQLAPALEGHTNVVLSVAFSPDGELLVSSSCARLEGGWCKQGEIRVWDAETGESRGEPLLGHGSWVSSVAFSPVFEPGGLLLASGGWDHTVMLWDMASRQPIGEPLQGHTGPVMSVAFSHDGRFLASGSRDKRIIVWDVETRQPLGQPFTGHIGQVRSVVFHPFEALLASGGSDQVVILWDLEGRSWPGERLVKRQSGTFTSAAFAPDGQTLAWGDSEGVVTLWDVEAGQETERWSIHSAWINALAFSPDGRVLASASDDKSVVLWDVARGRPLFEPMQGHIGEVTSVAFAPQGKVLASAGVDQSIILWNVETGEPIRLLLDAHAGWIWDVAFSPDGRTMASCSQDGAIILWDVASWSPRGEPLAGHSGGTFALAFSPDGRTLASCGGDKTIMLWDVATGERIGEPWSGHNGRVRSVAFGAGGQVLASSGEDDAIILWDVATGQRIGPPLGGHTAAVVQIAFSPVAPVLASVSRDGTSLLWNLDVGWWRSLACRRANRDLTPAEWALFVGAETPYQPGCSQLRSGGE